MRVPATSGNRSSTVVPVPGVDASLTVPPDWRAKSRTIARPRPVPRPGSLVVKNGSNAWPATVASMPVPVSQTATATNAPARSGSSATSPGATRTRRIDTTTRPPSSIASRAFSARLTRACSSWPASTRATECLVGPADGEVDAAVEQAMERRLDRPDRRADVDHGRQERGPPGEGEELPGELAGPFDDVDDRRGVLADGDPVLGLPLDQGREAADRRERVVEIVRDAAREATDGLEPLGMGELRLERDALGHVRELAGDPDRPSVGIAEHGAIDLDPDLAPVLRETAHAITTGRLAGHRASDALRGCLPFVVRGHRRGHRPARGPPRPSSRRSVPTPCSRP